MTRLSSGHNPLREDGTAERLLLLDGEIMVLGSGFWVTIKARRVAPSAARPHGIDYGLCLLGPDDERLICYDNAHPVAVGSGPAKQTSNENDHVHKGERVIPYRYTDAETLLVDFWDDVDRLMREMAP